MDDVLVLARAQFGLNIGFHILFPSLTIALGWILLYFRVQYARSGDPAWLATYKLWTKVFALSFAMGVVSGITMSFQFGTNWPGFMQKVGNIAGPLLAYEVLTAFFLEATFLGVMLFGMNRVPGWMHVVAGLSAWRLLRAGEDVSARKTLRTGLVLAAVLAPLQIAAGDLHGLNTLEHQPAKIAAIEAIWKTEKGVPLVLFAVPNEEKRTNDFAVEIPEGASLILRHDADAELQGIDAFAPDAPPVAPVFFAFRAMVGIGVLMLALAWVGVWATRRGSLPSRRLLWTLSGFTFAGWVATLAGWLVAEIGRQPWLVTGVLKTADAVGAASGAALGASLTGYIVTYAGMLTAYMVVLTHLAGKGAQA